MEPKANISKKPTATKKAEKFFDIAKPGSAVASATTRPTLITQRTMMQDPMMAQQKSSSPVELPAQEGADDASSDLPRVSKLRIEPLANAHEPMPDDSSDQPQVEMNDASKPHISSAQPEAESAQESMAATAASDNEDIDEMNELAGQAVAKKAQKHEAEEAEKRQKEIEALLTSKKYVLPIRAAHRRPLKHRSLEWMAVVGVIVVVGVFLAIDAGLVDVNFDLPFDLI